MELGWYRLVKEHIRSNVQATETGTLGSRHFLCSILVAAQVRYRSFYRLCKAGQNTSTVALRIARRDEKGTQCPAQTYNWAALFLRDTNKGTWPSRLWESHMRQLSYDHEFCWTRAQV
jgi:hypothetical protein